MTYTTQSEHVLATIAATTRNDLDRLAERLSASGTLHHVYRNPQGDLVVYAEAYAAPLRLTRA
jgi:hypothetical protein